MKPEDVEWVRSKRKTMAIVVQETGAVQVRTPMRVSRAQVEAFLERYRDWIARHAEQRRLTFSQKQKFSCGEGDTLPVLGREYPVRIGEKAAFTGEDFVIPDGDFAQVKPGIIAEYRRLARLWIPKRVQELAAQSGLVPSSVRITSAKRRWGSCSGKNSLNFSWRLIWASPETVDYVIFHELCHIRHHDHSADFWRLVEHFVPDYRERQGNLKQISRRFGQENWE